MSVLSFSDLEGLDADLLVTPTPSVSCSLRTLRVPFVSFVHPFTSPSPSIPNGSLRTVIMIVMGFNSRLMIRRFAHRYKA
jgi:hypothetical protein